MLHDDILLLQYCGQYILRVFHNKHHTYINISQIKANEDSRRIYDPQATYSDIQYEHSNLILIQENEKGST